MNSIVLALILQIILIALNAVFACAEIAVISVNELRLEQLMEQGNKKAARLQKLTKQPARFLAVIQVAITLSGFLGSAFAADNFAGLLVDWLVGLGVPIPAATLNTVSVILITLILSYITLVFGELVPKRMAMKKSEQLALGMASMLSFVAKLFAPLVWALTASTNGVLRLFGIDPDADEEEDSEAEIRMLVDAGSRRGSIDMDEKEMIQNVFEFDDISVGEFDTHRTEIDALYLEDSPDVWEKSIRESGHSRYPVCGEDVDDVVGILNVKDYYRLDDKSRENVMAKAVTAPYFVPESLRADVLFRQMKQRRDYFAVVLDEYGGVSGIVTMSNLIEQIVGEIEDDEAESPELEQVDGKTWMARGSLPLEELEEKLNIKLPDGDYDTLGGLIFDAHGFIPEDGARFELDIPPLRIKVLDIREHRIEKAMLCLLDDGVGDSGC